MSKVWAGVLTLLIVSNLIVACVVALNHEYARASYGVGLAIFLLLCLQFEGRR